MISGAAETVQIDADLSKEANQLSLAASEANLKILSDKNPQNKGMGTTLSAILIKDRRAVLVHVGDSRIYLLRHNVLTQLTADHSLVAEHVRNGILTEEEARKSSLQNILTRAMGISPTILLDVEELEIKPGDKILLCTDGLNKVVTDAEIIKVLIETDSAAIICKTLTDAALLAGAPDNVTVAAILVHGE
jgi:protein phosphatase